MASPCPDRHPYLIDRQVGSARSRCRDRRRKLGPLNLPVAGGGYFRILPYWWTQVGYRAGEPVESRPAVFYLHPWEIDPISRGCTPAASGNFGTTATSTRRRHGCGSLLTDFRFDAVDAVVAQALAMAQMDGPAACPLPYSW